MRRQIEPARSFDKRLLLSVAGITAVVVSISIALALVPRTWAQPPASIAFEVASVKPHKADDNRRSMPQFLPGGRFVSTGIPLRMVIATAYHVGFQSVRLSGGPDWITSLDGVYDIEATPPPGVIPAGLPGKERDEKLKLMLQTLLADRF